MLFDGIYIFFVSVYVKLLFLNVEFLKERMIFEVNFGIFLVDLCFLSFMWLLYIKVDGNC